jgi:hypothetical protein
VAVCREDSDETSGYKNKLFTRGRASSDCMELVIYVGTVSSTTLLLLLQVQKYTLLVNKAEKIVCISSYSLA